VALLHYNGTLITTTQPNYPFTDNGSSQAFISCSLDYCNSLLYGIFDSLIQRLQSVKNAVARLVTGAPRSDDITPVLRQLHWLPVRQRIRFKIAGCVFQALTSQAPAYFANDCRLISDSDRRRLRSSDIRTSVTPWTSTRFDDSSFFSCWSSCLERSIICVAGSGLDVWPFQTRT